MFIAFSLFKAFPSGNAPKHNDLGVFLTDSGDNSGGFKKGFLSSYFGNNPPVVIGLGKLQPRNPIPS
jgi:hypothetical protein